MNNSIEIVVSSRKNDVDNMELLENIKNTCGPCNCHVNYLFNPDGISLTELYNKYLKSTDLISDIIIFMHDDIEFLRGGWGAKIVELFNKHPDYGIIGIAGSAEFDEQGAWWNYNKKYGQVVHRNNGRSWLTAFSPLLDKDLEEVCVVDGLFIAVNRKRISKPFDESFKGFNHYDTSFCLDNYVDGETKIGVTTEIRVAHNSIGETKVNWFDNLKLLNKKFGDYYPIDVEEDNRLEKNGKL